MIKYICRNKSKKMVIQDINFLSLAEFYKSIPGRYIFLKKVQFGSLNQITILFFFLDYNDINHLNERQFYEKLECLKKKQQELTKSKRRKHCDYFHGCNEIKLEPLNLEECSTNSIIEFDKHSKDNKMVQKLPPDTPRPKSCTVRKKKSESRLSNIDDDYEILKSLKNYRSKSISPSRISIYEAKMFETKSQDKDEKDDKFYSDLTNDQLSPVDHKKRSTTTTTTANKEIPITSRIPLYDMVVEDQKHKNQLAKLDSAIKLQSQMKPFHFNESRNSTRKCLSRSFSTPHLNFTDNESEMDSSDCVKFKATPFPKNLFCNFVHYKMWEDNYFR